MTDTSSQEMRGFTLLETTTPTLLAPRLGRFALPGRATLQTPGFIATTSRGAVPHLAPDVLKEHTAIQGLYAGFEDFIERAKHDSPPIYKTPAGGPEGALRRFMCVPEEMLLVMGPRRAPPVACPTPSSATSVTVMTSDGYRQLTTGQYLEAVRRLRPDVVVGLADLVLDRVPGVKRRERMVDRTHGWTVEAVQRLFGEPEEGQGRLESLYFAPLLPLSGEQQWLYTRELEQDMREHVAGFAVYDATSLAAVPESLSGLARLSLSNPKTPQDVLREISMGVDITTVPFVGSTADGGIALDFVFPAPEQADIDADAGKPLPLGFDMWPDKHVADTNPLIKDCTCYTCRTFHRAYIRHLLNAKEMLAWTLLHVHNLHVMDEFFASVRRSIARGTFEEDAKLFAATYQSEMPEQTGQGPRLRGYQFKTEKGDTRKNDRVYGRLDAVAAAGAN